MHSDEMLTVDDDTPPAVTSPAMTNSDSQTAALPKLTKSGRPDQRSARSPARLAANKNNAKTAGIPKGLEFPHKRTLIHQQEKAIEAIATSVLEKGETGIRNSPTLGPVTEKDRRVVARVLGMPAEDFQSRIATKLEEIADKVAARMQEKLDADLYKPAELNMALAISLDKHAAVSGRNALKGASVNIQVNNYGETSKEALIAEIRGAMGIAEAVKV